MDKYSATVLASLFSVAALGDILLQSGTLMLPTRTGAFSETTTDDHAVEHIYFSLDEEEFELYENDSAALFEDYLDGCFENAEFFWKRASTNKRSASNVSVIEYDYILPEGEPVYFAGVFIYINENSGATNYIARAVTTVAPEDIFENLAIPNIAVGAGCWTVIGGPPAPPSWAEEDIADEDVPKYESWLAAQKDAYGDSFDPDSADYARQYLMNAPARVPVILKIDGIETTAAGSRIFISATAGNAPHALGANGASSINGYLNLRVGHSLNSMQPRSTSGAVTYESGRAVINVPASAGSFIRATVDWARAAQELTAGE